MTEPEKKLLIMMIHGLISHSMDINQDPDAPYIGDLLEAANNAGISLDELWQDTQLRCARPQGNDPH